VSTSHDRGGCSYVHSWHSWGSWLGLLQQEMAPQFQRRLAREEKTPNVCRSASSLERCSVPPQTDCKLRKGLGVKSSPRERSLLSEAETEGSLARLPY
jgi:hypothetical protein